MSVADTFKSFLNNIKVDNADTISLRYGEITCALNQQFRQTESKTANSLQVGSYGRHTAIKGISDLDMLYVMPKGSWQKYEKDGQSKLLSDAAAAIRLRHPRTDIKVDRLVVQVRYGKFHVEVQPVFLQDDGSFKYPETYYGGSWKITKPTDELRAMSEFNSEKNNNLRRLCKMVRSWKNKHGVGLGGLLIDTLAHNFLQQTIDYDEKSYLYYDWMSRDFFLYLSNLPKQEYFAALGSGQRVHVKEKFQKKAKKAYELCLKAIAADKEKQPDRWRSVFGPSFPKAVSALESASTLRYQDTEEYAEEVFDIDVRYSLSIDCEVIQKGFRPASLRDMIANRTFLDPKKELRFTIVSNNIPVPFGLFWKVLNRGPEAERRDCIRGQIKPDRGHHNLVEHTLFKGDHVVECYAVISGVVVAKDRIHVPITSNSEDLGG
jgi:hypothetical protein